MRHAEDDFGVRVFLPEASDNRLAADYVSEAASFSYDEYIHLAAPSAAPPSTRDGAFRKNVDSAGMATPHRVTFSDYCTFA